MRTPTQRIRREANQEIVCQGLYRYSLAEPGRAPKLYADVLAFIAHGKPRDGKEMAEHHRELQRLLSAYHKAAGAVVTEVHNLVPTAGRSVLARRLANETTYTGIINYAALGDDATVPANADTTLTNETYRKTIDSQTYVNNVAYLSIFVPAGVATDIHYEAGLFIDGTASVDTGQMFSHVLLSPPVDKGALTSLTLDVTLTIV